jgi:hypothetical protein
MKKFTAKEIDRLGDAAREVESVLAKIEQLRVDTLLAYETLIGELDEPQETVRGMLEDAANAAADYYDNRSEKWQEGDTGSAYATWRDELQSLADGAAEPFEAPDFPEIETPDWLERCASYEPDFVEFED